MGQEDLKIISDLYGVNIVCHGKGPGGAIRYYEDENESAGLCPASHWAFDFGYPITLHFGFDCHHFTWFRDRCT
jgi:hypothetical protein